MTTQSVPEPYRQSQVMEPAAISPIHRFFWLIRRELYEYRILYIVPLVAAQLFLIGFVIHTLVLRRRMQDLWPLPAHSHQALALPFEISSGLIMGTALLVGLYYSLETLYGERRDRSILFWKSLPVSDLETVLSKFTIPLVVIPLFSFAVTIVTQLVMLLLGSLVLVGSGANIAEIWRQSSFFQLSLTIFYHIVTVHGLWYAPIYGWLFLVSAWSRRAPLIWAVLPPFVICGVEKIAFNSTHFLTLIEERFLGSQVQPSAAPAGASMDMGSQLIPAHFFAEPGLWIGLVITAVFLAIAVRLRRSQGPI